MRSEVDLFEYEPFHSDKLAVPDKKSSYSMQEPLLRLDGATALYPVYASFVQAVYPREGYEDDSTDSVRCTTTPEAYENLLKGDTDLIFVAAPSDKQRELFEKDGKELIMVPLGMEAFVFFVNSENPVESLTTQQIQDIYSGNITNWRYRNGNCRIRKQGKCNRLFLPLLYAGDGEKQGNTSSEGGWYRTER